MVPTTTGRKEAMTWKGRDDSLLGKIEDLEAVRDQHGAIWSCWRAETWRERLRIALTGKVWVAVYADRQPPICVVDDPKLETASCHNI